MSDAREDMVEFLEAILSRIDKTVQSYRSAPWWKKSFIAKTVLESINRDLRKWRP